MRVIISETQLKKAIKSSLNENEGKDLLDKILSWTKDKINKVEKLFDDPKKADKLDVSVESYYNKLESISGPIEQQERGGFKWQEGVEAVQIGLILLGYQLPKFGVDGLFGPETAEAVNKFKADNGLDGGTPLNEAFINAGSTNYSHLKFSSSSSGDNLSQALLDDIQAAASSVNVVAKVTTANTGHSYLTTTGNVSRHTKNIAVDIGYLNGKVCNAKGPETDCGSFKTDGDKLKDALVSMGYVWNKEKGNQKAVLWQTFIGGNHYNHLHVSNNGEASGAPSDDISDSTGIVNTVITVEMVKVLIDKLKAGDLVTTEVLKKHVDPAKVTGGDEIFTDLDILTPEGYSAYRKICDNYIATRNPSGPITGTMMADSAKMAMERYRKYIPPELALAQITVEGGLSTDYTNKPHRTKNPFNVGQNKKISNPQPTYQAGIDLYYSLIARRYMTNGKTASDLIRDFKNDEGSAYAEAGYESAVTSLIASIRKKNEPIYKELAV